MKIFESSDLNMKARMTWKYAATRGLYGDPLIFINNVLNDQQNFTVEKLKKLFLKHIFA